MKPIATEKLEVLFDGKDSVIARDLKLNLNRLLVDAALPPEEALLTVSATAHSLKYVPLMEFAIRELSERGFSAEQIREAGESAAIMAMLNTYYRFKHMVAKEDDYRAANLRMTALAKPQLGKERFEMLALAVSILNGCESCIKAHEKTLRDAGVGVEKIHDIARISAVVKAIATL